MGWIDMEGWATDTVMLRFLAVAFIILAATAGTRKRFFTSVLALTAFSASIAWHVKSGGSEGVLYALSGVAVAILASLPLLRMKRISRAELFVSIALGSMLGLACSSMVFLVAYLFLAVQAALRADFVLIQEGMVETTPRCDADLLLLDEKSALAEIEAYKILRSEGFDFKKHYLLPARLNDLSAVSPSQRYVNILPWPAKLAFGTLAVLMYGFPV
jgi:hypothetical protein